MHAQIKNQPLPTVRQEVPGLLIHDKFRSRCERGRFTQSMLLPRGLATLHLAVLRRGLATAVMKRVAWFGAFVSLALFLFGCGKSREQAVRELERLNLKAQSDDFVRSAEQGDKKALPLFFEAGIDINARNNGGYTALMAAAKNGQAEIVNKLLEQKANVDVQGYNGWTALMLAAENNQLSIVKALLAKNADPNLQDNSGWTALMKAVYQGNTDCVVAIADRSRQEVNRGLLVAALMDHKDTAKALLDRGAEIDTRADDGRTPLMLAASKGFADLVSFFLQEGADRSLTDNSGNTAATLASAKGSREVTSLLQNAPPPTAGGAAGNSGLASLPNQKPAAVSDREMLAPSKGTPGEPNAVRRPAAEQSQESDQSPMAENVRILSIQQEFLPAMLTEISERKAKIRDANGDYYSVTTGDQLRGLDYKVTQIEVRSTEDKDGNPVDDSAVKLQNTKTGEVVTLIKGIPAREHASYALLSVSRASEPMKVETDQNFSIPGDPGHTYKVLDIRPAQIIVKRIEDNRVFTLQKK
jgi:ankyrin repeat protein